MNLTLKVVLASFLGGVVSLAGGVGMLFMKDRLLRRISELTGFAAGVLITVAVLDLLPEAFEGEPNLTAAYVLAGILFLFFLEKFSLWFHHHHEPHGRQPDIYGVFLGDTLHNFVDGLAIGAAFLVSDKAGIATAIAVGMHEIPQEIADFGLYIKAGFGKLRTIGLNLFSSLTTILGAVLTLSLGEIIGGVEIYILGFTAGMFLYIAMADLIPELHEEKSRKKTLSQVSVFVLGMALAYLSIKLFD